MKMTVSPVLPLGAQPALLEPTDRQGGPLVTIAIPTLNRTRYLKASIGSALAQNYPNLEILISDNGSRDDTREVARELAGSDARVRFRMNETTVPQHVHFRQCLEEAKGEYYILLCDDDVMIDGFVSELVAVAGRHPDLNVVLPASRLIDDSGLMVRQFDKPKEEVQDGCDFVRHWLWGRDPQFFPSVVTTLARTSVLRGFGGHQAFEGGRNTDNLLFLQTALTSRVGFAGKALFESRIHLQNYGGQSTAEQITKCSRQFMDHLRQDPATVSSLASLGVFRRYTILAGVSYMTAKELLYQVNFLATPFRVSLLLDVLRRRHDSMCLVAISHFWYMKVRSSISQTIRAAIGKSS